MITGKGETMEELAMRKRIKQATTTEQFDRIDQQLLRLYNAGVLTEAQFSKLDLLNLDRRIKAGKG